MQTLREQLRRLGTAARASSKIAEEDREAIGAVIEEADLAHMSVREIARETGYSPSWVHSIILARTAARQARHAQAVGLG